jgi:glycerol-3-phosphate dehydrogenase
MPDRYRKEVQRIMQAGSSFMARDLADIAEELEALTDEAAAIGQESLADLIRTALSEARRLAELRASAPG